MAVVGLRPEGDGLRLDERIGATPVGDACQFRVWAPDIERVDVHLIEPEERLERLAPESRGYHAALIERVSPGALYRFRLDGETERPDPASRTQPLGVHGPSAVVDPTFPWSSDTWRVPGLADWVLYELHIGTWTAEGTFDAAAARLPDLAELGVNAVELMPIAQFPGSRNWGYDGAYPFAAQSSYGGIDGLRRFVDAAHRLEMAVVLDVVYNHLGPEGAYLRDYGPYFTGRYCTPWGEALNFDGAHADEVRRFFIESALHWTLDCRIDGLRLDAVHAIMDASAYPFLQELAERVHAEAARRNRRIEIIAESDANDPRLIRGVEAGGYGLDAQWSDDFHHALHALLTGERTGYYQDFGRVAELGRAFTDGYVYTGERSAYRGRRHGRSPAGVPAKRFIVFAQNHDQVGNRMSGERLTELTDFESIKVAAAAVLLSPFVPLLFMGEEHAATAPFPYFISHGDPELVEAVRRGRAEEFAAFDWSGGPPDPQAEQTFAAARPGPASAEGQGAALRRYLTELIRLRRGLYDRERPPAELVDAVPLEAERALLVLGRDSGAPLAMVLRFAAEAGSVSLPLPEGEWRLVLDSTASAWDGPGAAAPDRLALDGIVALRLPARAALLYRAQMRA